MISETIKIDTGEVTSTYRKLYDEPREKKKEK